MTETVKINSNKWLKHRNLYSESRRELKEATLANQATLKAAKADGVHIDAMKLVDLFDRKDTADARALFNCFVQGAIVQKCEWMMQGDLLDGGGAISDLFTPNEPSPRTIEAFEDQKAYELGYTEALAGGSVSNIHAVFGAGSAQLVMALKGWDRGTKLAEKYATPGVKKTPSSGKGRRSKVAASDDAEQEEPASEIEAPEEQEAREELDHPLAEPGEPEAVAVPSNIAELSMDQVREMSLNQMCEVHAQITGGPKRNLKSKAVAIASIEGALKSASHAAN